MKPEEVIKYLEMVRPTENYSHTFSVSVGNTRHFGPGSQLNKDVSTAIGLAIEALEKQTPTKPEMYIGDYEFERWPICPRCKGELHPNGEKFCSDCGQAIDWSESE